MISIYPRGHTNTIHLSQGHTDMISLYLSGVCYYDLSRTCQYDIDLPPEHTNVVSPYPDDIPSLLPCPPREPDLRTLPVRIVPVPYQHIGYPAVAYRASHRPYLSFFGPRSRPPYLRSPRTSPCGTCQQLPCRSLSSSPFLFPLLFTLFRPLLIGHIFWHIQDIALSYTYICLSPTKMFIYVHIIFTYGSGAIPYPFPSRPRPLFSSIPPLIL